MRKFSYAGYRFPPEIIRQAIWLYLRFTLSLRDIEDLLAERGIIVSYETVEGRHERGRWRNNRAENSHQPTRRRERKMQRFKSSGSAQKFLSSHAAVFNTFHVQRHLTSAQTHRTLRAAAMKTWREAAVPM